MDRSRTCSRKQGSHTLRGAVKAISEGPFDPIRRLLLRCNALKLAIGLRKGHGTGLRGVAQVPEHAATDDGRQIHLLRETAAMFFVGQDIDGQRQPTPGQHGDETLAPKRADQAVEGHGGDMVEHGAQLQTEAAVRGQEGITGHLRAHRAIA